MNTLPAIVSAIVTALAADLGTVDLSATGQVREGTFSMPPGSNAFAAVLPAQMTGSEAQARNAWYLETYEIEIRLWAPVTASGTDDRVHSGRTVAEEAMIALDNARTNTATALWRCVTFGVSKYTEGASAANELPGWAHSALLITLSFRRATGTGT